ncbi:hypothetical protein PVNG_02376 [Plasmodium vivax North Korean]|uniref:PTS EIIA type-1 domain-containing protein n=1 Tax=Plasmodium vivax North Korean TaxID=1035514 RepID=A0A0J9W6N3_PLAVI|nr:hypothetical protein PVNG_02376 [Plasmodium vivax North Korean]
MSFSISTIIEKIKIKFSSFYKVENDFVPIEVYSPFDGIVVDQKEIPDEGFSEGYMGVGVGLKPREDGSVVSPLNGNLEVLFKTQHAYIIREHKHKIAVMLHLGVNTVNISLDKKAFFTELVQGQDVIAKQDLCVMNLDVIREHATSDISALLVQNENMEGKIVKIHKKVGEEIKKGELLLTILKSSN